MIVTADMLRDWGGNCSGIEWFEMHYPKGVEITAENVRKCPSEKHNKLWLLKQVAARAKDASAQAAVDMLVETAEPHDTSWLAAAVIECAGVDTGAALGRVLASGDRECLMRVAGRADIETAERAAKELVAVANPATLTHIEREWAADRRALVDGARRARKEKL